MRRCRVGKSEVRSQKSEVGKSGSPEICGWLQVAGYLCVRLQAFCLRHLASGFYIVHLTLAGYKS